MVQNRKIWKQLGLCPAANEYGLIDYDYVDDCYTGVLWTIESLTHVAYGGFGETLLIDERSLSFDKIFKFWKTTL